MMSKEIFLHGGDARLPSRKNDRFFKDLLDRVPENGTVLLVNFASDPSKKSRHTQEDISQFEKAKGDKHFKIIKASENDFYEQIKLADLVYFSGGETSRLLKILSNLPKTKQYLAEKTIAGESAGAKSLCLYAISSSGGGIIKGLGLAPFTIICHYEDGQTVKGVDINDPGVLVLHAQEYFIFNRKD